MVRSKSKHRNSRISTEVVILALGEFGPSAMLFWLGDLGD